MTTTTCGCLEALERALEPHAHTVYPFSWSVLLGAISAARAAVEQNAGPNPCRNFDPEYGRDGDLCRVCWCKKEQHAGPAVASAVPTAPSQEGAGDAAAGSVSFSTMDVSAHPIIHQEVMPTESAIGNDATTKLATPPAPEKAGDAGWCEQLSIEWLMTHGADNPSTNAGRILAHISQLESANAELRGTEERLTRKQHMSDLNYDALEKATDSYAREARLHRASLNEVGAERDSLQQQLAEARK